jgi:hypothetical protein
MQQLFAVTRSRGAGWDASRPMEEQKGWRQHADFMNALHEERFVLLGGPAWGERPTCSSSSEPVIRKRSSAE